MRKSLLILLSCVLIISFNNKSYAQQVLTKYGDNVGTLDGIIKAYYDVVSVKKGHR